MFEELSFMRNTPNDKPNMELQLESSNGLKKMQQFCFTRLSPFSRVRGSAAPCAARAARLSCLYTPGLVSCDVWRFGLRFVSAPLSRRLCGTKNVTSYHIPERLRPPHRSSLETRERHMPMLARCACSMSLRTAGGTRASRMGFGDDSVRT